MGTRILLVSNNTYKDPYSVFPLGIAHVASALINASYTVKIADLIDNSLDLAEIIKRFNPHYIGISQRNIDDINILNSDFLARKAASTVGYIHRMTDAPVIIGGSGFSIYPEKLLEFSGADFGIAGEGERSFVELIRALSSKRNFEKISGLVYRKNGRIIVNRRRHCALSDILPAIRPESLCRFYLSDSLMLNIQTQRGCPYKCCYCSYPVIEGNRTRRRDIMDLCDELESIRRTGCRYFFIVDSVFNTSKTHVNEFCEELIKRDLKMTWGCYIRPRGLTNGMMKLMARAGLRHIEFGSDSFSDSVLDAYGKQFTFSDILHASNCALAAGIRYAHFLIAGGPGENEKTLEESYKNSCRISRTVFFAFVGMRIYPETRLINIAIKDGIIDENTDLFMPVFYISPGLTKSKIFSVLNEFNGKSLNWIVEGSSKVPGNILRGLRLKGVTGPLWEFIAR
jgi:radical SAM superfamily enzyme YgiQ (UPF0313 family)